MNMRQVDGAGVRRGGRRGRIARAVACAAVGLGVLGGVEIARGGAPSSQRPEPKLSATQRNLVELGRRLFFEPALSAQGVNACASCHLPEHGFGDARRFSAEDVGHTSRHSQDLIDVDLDADQHWDGEFLSIAALVESRTRSVGTPSGYGSSRETTPGRRAPRPDSAGFEVALAHLLASQQRGGRVAGPGEAAGPGGATPQEDLGLDPGFGAGLAVVVHARLRDLPPEGVEELLRQQTADALRRALPSGEGAPGGDGADRVTQGRRYLEALTALGAAARQGRLDAQLAGEAIEAYVATIRSGRSAYDRFRAGEAEALSPSQQRGLALFRGRAGCVSCHKEEGPQGWPLFRDGGYHNSGVAWLSDEPAPGVEAAAVPGVQVEGPRLADEGRGRFLAGEARERAFKTPSLRDVARHPPYMHDGSKKTLEDVVLHYASGCGDDPGRDARLKGFDASQQDIQDLVAFLESLTSEERPGLAREAWKKRAQRTRLRFLDQLGRPVPGLLVGLEMAGDRVPETLPVPLPPSLETDDQGEIGYVVPGSTHVRLKVGDAIQVVGGNLVPDTCSQVDIRLQVAGRLRLALVVDDPALATPLTLRAYEPAGAAPPDPASPRLFHPQPWVLHREGTIQVGERTAVLYEGYVKRVGARSLALRLPGQEAPQEVLLGQASMGGEADADATVRADVTVAGSPEWRAVAR